MRAVLLGLLLPSCRLPATCFSAADCSFGSCVNGVCVSGGDTTAGDDNGDRQTDGGDPAPGDHHGDSGDPQVGDSDACLPSTVGADTWTALANRVAVSGSWLYVAGLSDGIAVVDASSPEAPQHVANLTTVAARRLSVLGSVLYAVTIDRLVVVDITTPEAPVARGEYTPVGVSCVTSGVEARGTFAYLATGACGLHIVDITDPDAPSLHAQQPMGIAHGVALIDGHALVTTNLPSGVEVIDVSDPWGTPNQVGFFALARDAYEIAVRRDLAVVTLREFGVDLIDFSNPAQPVAKGHLNRGTHLVDVAVSGNTVLLPDELGLRVVDISNPMVPEQLFVHYFSDALGAAWLGNLAVVVADFGGVEVVDVCLP